MGLEQTKILGAGIVLPALVSVLFGIVGIKVPSEFSVYCILISSLLFLKVSTGNYKIWHRNDISSVYFMGLMSLMLFYSFFTLSNQFVYEKVALFCYLVLAKLLIFLCFDYRVVYLNRSVLYKSLALMSAWIVLLFFYSFPYGLYRKQ